MKRTHHNPLTSKHYKKAMALYRETRRHIKATNPGLLSATQTKLSGGVRGGDEKIDRQKNLQTIITMMKISKRSSNFQNELYKMIVNAGV